MQNIKEQFKNLKQENDQLRPDRAWVMENKDRLMSQIVNNVTPNKKHFSFEDIWEAVNIILPGRMVYSVVRPVAVFMLIAVVATSGWIAGVSATANSLPGDIGYGVKLATEKTQEIVTVVTGSDDDEAQMHMEFASRRAKEVKKVVENKDAKTSQKVDATIKRLEKSIDSANDKIKEVGENNPEKIVEATKAITEKSKEINADLKEAGKQDGAENIAEAKKKVTEVGLTAVEAVVKAKESGSLVVSDEDVKDLVNEQINNILAEVDEIKTEAQKVVKDLEETENTSDQDIVGLPVAEDVSASSSVLTEDVSTTMSGIVSTTSSSTSSNTSTMVLDDKIIPTVSPAEVKTVVTEALKKINDTGDIAVKDLTDAKTLVQNNQIFEAIEKVKQVTGTTQETEKAVTQVKKVINKANQVPVVAPTVVESVKQSTVSTTSVTEAIKPTSTIDSPVSDRESVVR